jgi:hypothetical protein
MRVNWHINQEMIITQLNIIMRIKLTLLARSMTPVRGHAYKRLGGSPEYKTRKYFSPFSSSSLSFVDSAVVLRCFKLAAPTPCHAWGDEWAGSPNQCHREARSKDGNKVSGQRICTTTQSCTSTIRAATWTFGIVYIDGLLRLLCTNHLSTDKIQRWAHDSLCINGLVLTGVCVSSSEYSWNLPQTKIWI